MSKVGSFMVLIAVPFLLYVGLLMGFFGVVPLKVDVHSIVIVGAIFLIYLFFVPHNAFFALKKYEDSKEKIDAKLSSYLRSFNLKISNTTKSTSSVESFFGNYYRNFRNDNYSSIAPSLFPTLGILGTFISVAISMPDFSLSSGVTLESEVSKLLMGIGTAFYASIYGIFLSIWWVMFEKSGMTKLDKIVIYFRHKFKDLIWNSDEMRYAELQERREQQRSIVDIMKALTEEGYVEKINNIAKLRFEEIERLSRKQIELEDITSRSIEKLLFSLQKAIDLQNEIYSSSSKLKDEIGNLLERVELRVENNDTILNAFKAEIYNFLSSVERIASEIKSASVKLSENKR